MVIMEVDKSTMFDNALDETHSDDDDIDPLTTVDDSIDRWCIRQTSTAWFILSSTQESSDSQMVGCRPTKVTPTPCDYDSLHPCFAWLPANIIEKMFQVTTRLNTHVCHSILAGCPFVDFNFFLDLSIFLSDKLLKTKSNCKFHFLTRSKSQGLALIWEEEISKLFSPPSLFPRKRMPKDIKRMKAPNRSNN